MLIALTKLADIAARSLFVLIVLYALPVRSSGQFGLALTLIGFFAFLSGFERYADLQRRMVGASEVQTDRLVVSTLRFWALNYLPLLPALAALLVFWVDLPWQSALLCLPIALGEHLSNEVYRIALIAPRHRAVLFAVLAKNVALLAIVGATLATRSAQLELGYVLALWAAAAVVGTLAIAALFTKTWAFDSLAGAGGAGLVQAAQYRASSTHFVIGIVALAALQADRIVVGSLLTLEQSGVYFRHIFLAAFAYQIFNVACYNRIAPEVYARAHAGQPAAAKAAIRRERVLLVLAAGLLVGLIYALAGSPLGKWQRVEALDVNMLAALTLGYLVRALADFNALLLNAVYAERQVFHSQAVAVAFGLVVNIALTRLYGLPGTVASLMLGAVAYLALSSRYARRNPVLNPQPA